MATDVPDPGAANPAVEELRARLLAAEQALRARDKTIAALVQRERDRANNRHSAYRMIEENAELQHVVERKTLELEVQNRKLERASNELRQSNALWEVLMENSPTYIAFKDRRSRFVRCSRSVLAALNLPDLKALRGKTDGDFFTEAFARETARDEAEIIRTGRPIVGKIEKVEYRDGRHLWALTTKMPWRNHARIIGTFMVATDLTAIKTAEARLEATNKRLVQASRLAGMAEVATNVLHNVGNVLNSVNVSATLISDTIRQTKVHNLAKLATLLETHQSDLASFLTNDPRGRVVPAYVRSLATSLTEEHQGLLTELGHLRKNIEHIKDIVAMQQRHARFSGLEELVCVQDLIEDAIQMNADSLMRHGVALVRRLDRDQLHLTVEKNKLIQILVNLLSNARHACSDSGRPDKEVVVACSRAGDDILIEVTDNGVGISADHLVQIFAHGFTTRKEGHGFGLHSSALAAKELGGSLTVRSDGPGKGASFLLRVPVRQPQA